MSTPPRRPKFCPDCGAELPPGEPRFCVECGAPTGLEPAELPAAAPAATGPTVRLANARVAQEVIGGTVRLPSLGAVPPGLWDHDHPPGAGDVLAIYPPLRPVVRGWSGLIGRGWRAAGSAAEGATTVYLFRAPVEWFPAPGCGGGLRLLVEIEASSHSSVEGRERRGFRFGLRRDGPMRVIAAEWRDEADRPAPQPIPQLQIMAPPRVPRMTDVAEEPAQLGAREAAAWAEGSLAPGAYRLYLGQLQQEHTPAGRGATLLPLAERDAEGRPWWQRLIGGLQPARYRVRVEHPLRCALDEWPGLLGRMREEARSLGLDLEPALAAEWWLDRGGYDGVIFSGAQARYGVEQAVIVFRRGQLAQIRD
jgi:hypothetical protein